MNAVHTAWRRAVAAWPILSWLAIVAGLTTVAQLRPELEVAVLVTEAGLVGAIYVLLWMLQLRSERATTARLRGELAREKQTGDAMRDALHEHYLAAIRDGRMGSEAFGRTQRLAELFRHLQFPDIYPAPADPVDEDPDPAGTAQLDREVKAATWAGYGPDGEVER